MSSLGARTLVVDLNARSKSSALTPEGEARIRAAVPSGWELHVVQSETSSDGDGPPRPSDEVMSAIVDAEVYFGFGIPKTLFDGARRLRWVHSASAGVASALHDSMCQSDVVLTNSAGIYAIPIAEHVIAGVLHFLRGFDVAIDQQRRFDWGKTVFDRTDAPIREMDTVRALVVGVGGIGGAVATRLSALGATCTGVRRTLSRGIPAGFGRVVSLDAIDAELPHHDVIVLAAPLTPATTGLITAARLDLMPATAIVVNVARGAMLDEVALAERLQCGQIRGAVLDVFRTEPLAPSSPLWQLRSALVSPHISGVSPGRFWPRELDLFLGNWERYQRGEALRNTVNKAGGY